jgi:LPS export ABC transporter protein LptC
VTIRPSRCTALHPGSLSGLLAVTLLLTACGASPQASDRDGGPTPFVFRALDLRQQDLLGRPGWTLTSPEARYDLDSRIARADQPRGTIFRDGQPAYRLTASSGTVLNDGQLVLLEGNIRLEQLGVRPLLIQASRARWSPRRNLLELDRHPEAFDGSNRISSRRARYLFDQQKLEVTASPRFEHWKEAFDPFHPRVHGPPEIVVQSRAAHWSTRDGHLEASGPLKGRRLAPAGTEQTLTATALSGNTMEQWFTLMGPVQLRDPSRDLSFHARRIRIDLPARLIRTEPSTAPLVPVGAATPRSATAPLQTFPDHAGCLLEQRGDSLQADLCQWNWGSQNVLAKGSVALRRQEHRQLSRGTVLIGSLGDDGIFRLSSPGGRVVSRFEAPRAPQAPPPPPRPAPEPIRL